MFSRRNFNGSLVKCLFLPVALNICSSGCAPSSDGVIDIGLAAPITGPGAQVGDWLLAGAQAGIKYVNSKGGILGRKLSLVDHDDANRDQQAQIVANLFVSHNPKISVVVGHTQSVQAKAALEVYNEHKIDLFTAVNDDYLNEKKSAFVFRTVPTASEFAAKVAQEILLSKRKRIGIIRDDNGVNSSFSSTLKRLLDKSIFSQNVLLTEIKGGDKDQTAVVGWLKENAIDCIALAAFPVPAGLIMRQAYEQGLLQDPANRPFVIGFSTLTSWDYSKIAGPAAIGTKVVSIHGADPDELKNELNSNPNGADMLAAFGDNVADQFEVYCWLSFTAIQMAAQAIQATGSLDSVAISKYLHSATLTTALGNRSFDELGNLRQAEDIMELFEHVGRPRVQFVKAYGSRNPAPN